MYVGPLPPHISKGWGGGLTQCASDKPSAMTQLLPFILIPRQSGPPDVSWRLRAGVAQPVAAAAEAQIIMTRLINVMTTGFNSHRSWAMVNTVTHHGQVFLTSFPEHWA